MQLDKLCEDIQQHKTSIRKLEKELDVHSSASEKLEESINEYINSNPIAEERRKSECEQKKMRTGGKNALICFFALEIVAVLIFWIANDALTSTLDGAYLFIRIAVHLLLCILAVLAIINYRKASLLQHRIDEMSGKLVEFDKKLRPMEAEYERESRTASHLSAELYGEREALKHLEQVLEIEKKYAKYAVNYALVFVGEWDSDRGKYKTVRNMIEIDGQDYGCGGTPFKPIFLTPGIHTIKITVQDYFGDYYHYYSSDVYQFNVSNASIYFECRYVGAMRVEIHQHSCAKDFFDSTGQQP